MAHEHSTHSVLREIILEHLFVGRLLQRLWQAGIFDAEILHSEFDAGGYDLVLNHGKITRHIQLKALITGGKRRYFDIHARLTERVSGCVLVLVVNVDLEPDRYLWLGETAGRPLPEIGDYPPARHTKGNSDGHKAQRPNLHRVPTSAFQPLSSLEEVIERLLEIQL